jgi:hypothetical protein
MHWKCTIVSRTYPAPKHWFQGNWLGSGAVENGCKLEQMWFLKLDDQGF